MISELHNARPTPVSADVILNINLLEYFRDQDEIQSLVSRHASGMLDQTPARFEGINAQFLEQGTPRVSLQPLKDGALLAFITDSSTQRTRICTPEEVDRFLETLK